MGEQALDETVAVEGQSEGAAPAPAESPAPRSAREYVVLVAEMGPGPDVVGIEGHWGELGRVEAFNRVGALEEVERLWPSALEGTPRLHLIPSRFWSEVTPEEAPPPPPRRKWKGV